MKTIEISYNPYKMITRILIDKVDVCKNDSYDKFKEFIHLVVGELTNFSNNVACFDNQTILVNCININIFFS